MDEIAGIDGFEKYTEQHFEMEDFDRDPSPILFEWKMNADTTLEPGTVLKELIKLTYGQTEVNGYYSLQFLS